MKLLIKSAVIIDASSKHHLKKVDLLITNGKFEKIASKISNPDNRKEIKLKNLHISQGWFDSSVSFGEPGYEERETIENGLITAAKSGFTTIALNANTHPVTDSKSDIQFILSKAENSVVSICPIGALTQQSNGNSLAELFDMKNAGATAFYDYQKSIENPNLLKLALQYVQGFDGLIIAYCNDTHIAGNGMMNEEETSTKLGLKGIPALAEELHLNRNIFLLEYAEGKLHIPTISTEKSIEMIAEAKKRGLDITCSVSINNLVLTDEELGSFDSNLKLQPPLRTEQVNRQLIKALKDGIIDGVTSDHNPIDIEHKKVEFDHAMFGSIGLESIFGALQTVFTTEESILFLTRLKSRFTIPHTPINEEDEVNITMFNPDGEWIFSENDILSTSKNAALLNKKLKGKVYGVYAKKKLFLNK